MPLAGVVAILCGDAQNDRRDQPTHKATAWQASCAPLARVDMKT